LIVAPPEVRDNRNGPFVSGQRQAALSGSCQISTIFGEKRNRERDEKEEEKKRNRERDEKKEMN
jgi:hypothetical protein